MIRRWQIYRKSDGLFTGQHVSYPQSDGVDEFVSSTVPEGFAVKEGAFDYLSQKVDTATGAIVDYQPPQPDADHEWVHDDAQGNRVRRWVLKRHANERRSRVAAILADLAALDARMLRPLGELADEANLEPHDLAVSRSMVEQLNREKAQLRAELQSLTTV